MVREAKAMMKPNPPPLGVGWLWELRSFGMSRRFWLKRCLTQPVVRRLRRKVMRDKIKSWSMGGWLDNPYR
jgi:hypothetical protein